AVRPAGLGAARIDCERRQGRAQRKRPAIQHVLPPGAVCPWAGGYGRGINLSSMVGLPAETQQGARSLGKMLELLSVFTTAAPAWSTEDLIRFSGTSRSTCYRYIKTLHGA